MNRAMVTAVAAFLACLGVRAQIDAPAALSVAGAVRAALERNPDLAAARERVRQAEAQLDAARAAFLPSLAFDAGYLRGDAPSAYLFKRIDSRELPTALDFNDPGEFGNTEVGATLRWTLWDAGRRNLARSQAQHNAVAVAGSRDAVANELIGTTIQAYHDILAASEYVKVSDRSLDAVRAQLREVRARHELGSALKADVLAIEVREAQARERRIRAGNAEALAQSALRQLLDMDADASVSLSGEDWIPAELPARFEQGLLTALRNRPELRAIERRLSAARDGVALAKRQSWPQLDLAGRYWYDDENADFATDRDNWIVGATLTWTGFDGGLRRSGRRGASAALSETEAMRRSTVRAIELQVRQGYLNLDEARARFDVAKANIARAEEGLRLVRSLFENGSATVTRYLQSEEDRTEGLYREIRSRYDVKQAIANLGHALGLCLKCAAGGAAE